MTAFPWLQMLNIYHFRYALMSRLSVSLAMHDANADVQNSCSSSTILDEINVTANEVHDGRCGDPYLIDRFDPNDADNPKASPHLQ